MKNQIQIYDRIKLKAKSHEIWIWRVNLKLLWQSDDIKLVCLCIYTCENNDYEEEKQENYDDNTDDDISKYLLTAFNVSY